MIRDLLSESDPAAGLARLRAGGRLSESGLGVILDEVEPLVHSDPGAAAELAALCELGAESLGCRGLVARSRYLRARVLADRAEFEPALQLIEQARAGWWESGARLSALRTDLGRMQVLDDLGRHHAAADVGEAMVAGLKRLPETSDPDEGELRRWLSAAAQENLGVARGFLGDQEQALAAYRRAESEYQALDLRADVARARANAGIELLELGRATEAKAALESAGEIFRSEGDRLWSAKCAGHLAQAVRQTGDLFGALRLLEPARAELDALDAVPEAIRLQLTVARTYLDLGLYDEALSTAEAVAARTAGLSMDHDTAVAKLTIGLAQLGARRYEPAAADIAAAAELFEAVGDRQQLPQVRLAEAELAAATGRPDEAARLAADAAAALSAGTWPAPLVSAILRQADFAPDEAARDSALTEAGRLLELFPLPQLRYPYLLRTARLQLRRGDRQAAETSYRDAIVEAERLSGVLPDHTLRIAVRAERLAAYDELVGLLVAKGDAGSLDEAWATSDRAKARTLVDLLDGVVQPGRHATELRSLTEDLTATYSSLIATDQPGRRESLQRRAVELEQLLGIERLRLAAQEPIQSTPAKEQPRAGVLRGSAETPLVGYQTVGDDLIIFVDRGRDAVTVHREPGVLPEIELELGRLAAQWSRFQLGESFAHRHAATLLATTNEILGVLYRRLLAPVREQLKGSDRLLVVPDRRLYRVPVHALYDGKQYAGDQWEITVVPARQGAGVAPPAEPSQGRPLIVAVPDSNAPSVAAEAAALAELLPGARVISGTGATSEVFFRELSERPPAVLHIACHGLYRPSQPAFSSLRLADRWVTAAEILELDLRGTLVTLGACESGRHEQHTTEPVGLAWSFLAAGAAGVVVSQWLVSDRVTVDLMTGFYQAMRAGAAPAAALAQAQRSTALSHPHPFHWAPFSYVARPGAPTNAPISMGVA